MIDRIVLDQDVFARTFVQAGGTYASFEADAVVTHVHGAARDHDLLALHDVDAVAVLGVPGAAHRHTVEHHVAAVLRDQVELRGILQGHAFHADPLTVREADQMRPHPLLLLESACDIGEMLQLERIPEAAVVGDGTAHLEVFLPFHVADLAALDGPPPCAVAVDDPFAGDADVVAF